MQSDNGTGMVLEPAVNSCSEAQVVFKAPEQPGVEERTERLLKKQLIWTRVCAIALIVLIVGTAAFAAAVIPDLVLMSSTVKKVDAIADELSAVANELEDADIESIAKDLKTVSHELSQVDWQEMAGNINSAATDAQKGLNEALKTLDELDMEALNDAIANLQKVVAPLANLVGRFG